MENLIKIGTIVNTQGVKGDMKVVPDTFDIKRFELIKDVILENPRDKSQTRYDIEKVWYHKNLVILKFKDVDDMTAGEKLKTFEILIPEELRLTLTEDEYYVDDLYNMEVYDEDNNLLGILTNVLITGSNDVYVISDKKKGDLLIPAIKNCIKEVNVSTNKMVVHVLEGLEWQ